MEGKTTYTVDEAAAILQETPDRVREMLATGELEGIPPGATVSGDWKVLLPATFQQASPAPPVEESPESPPEEQEEAPADEESAQRDAAVEELSRGDSAATNREPTASLGSSGWVSTQQAARALGISPRTVRWHIEQGNLAAKPEGVGVRRTWLVSIDSLHALRDARQAAEEVPRSHRAPAEGADIAADTPGSAIRVLAERLEEAAARAAEYRVRLELTEQAESTLRAELEETRRHREEAERERDELRRELEVLRERLGPPAMAAEEPERAEPQPRSATRSAQRALGRLRHGRLRRWLGS